VQNKTALIIVALALVTHTRSRVQQQKRTIYASIRVIKLSEH